MGAIPEVEKISSLEARIEDTKKKKESLGLFKGKEKKALQEQIEELEKELTAVKESKTNAEKPFLDQIKAHKARIKKIDAELNKNR